MKARTTDASSIGNALGAALLCSLFFGFSSTSSAAEVAVRGQGSWDVSTGTTPEYWAEKGFWLDVTVQNLAYQKAVSVLWTDDAWATSQVSNLKYKYQLPNGYEVWGTEFAPLGRLDSYYIGGWTNYVTGQTRAGGQSVTIEYAVQYEVNGMTYWDNNSGQNYRLNIEL